MCDDYFLIDKSDICDYMICCCFIMLIFCYNILNFNLIIMCKLRILYIIISRSKFQTIGKVGAGQQTSYLHIVWLPLTHNSIMVGRGYKLEV